VTCLGELALLQQCGGKNFAWASLLSKILLLFRFQITKFAVWWCWAVLVWLQRVSLVRRCLEFFLIFEFCCSTALGEAQSDCAGCAWSAVW